MRAEDIERGLPGGEDLDPVAERLQDGIRGVLERPLGGRLADALNGTWLGHPLHPALTDIPLGCWTAALVLDVTGSREARRAADLVSVVGVAGAAGAAVTGAADWSRTGQVGRRLGLVHAGLNVSATVLHLTALATRSPAGRRSLRTLGTVLASVSGWLGGHLSYGLGINADRGANAGGPDAFTDVAALDDLPEGRPVRREAEGAPVVLVRRGGRVDALGAVCPHLGAPLDEGAVEGDELVCPWHGSRFRLPDGALCAGPATVPPPRFDTQVRDGRVLVARSPARAPAPTRGAEMPEGVAEGLPTTA